MQIVLGNVSIRAEIARTTFSHAIGLMGRSIPEDFGMLFMFPHTVRTIFWTFGMQEAIDIIFIDGSWQVVDIREHCAPWRSMILPKKYFRYALEVKAGTVARSGLVVGAQVATQKV